MLCRRPAARLGAVVVFVALIVTAFAPASSAQAERGFTDVMIVVHGGAGTIEEVDMTEAEEAAYREQLAGALRAGYDLLEEGASSTDAVEAAIQRLERSPLFNAGRGAVFTSAGTVEHDASIMEGSGRRAGAVAGTRHIASPIAAARLVMEESPHVMLAREGAEEFALVHGMTLVPNDHFYTPERRSRFLKTLTSDAAAGGSDGAVGSAPGSAPGSVAEEASPSHLGTVGAVARDRAGTLAAGTSTGGMSNKQWGRIGDSPIIGAGTYADDATAAVSATGWGEYFIRGAVAHEVAARMRHAGAPLLAAAHAVIEQTLPSVGDGRGTGGVIALDAEGNAAAPFNTPGMFRGWITEDGRVTVRFYGQDAYDDESESE